MFSKADGLKNFVISTETPVLVPLLNDNKYILFINIFYFLDDNEDH